jgi:hypothetical protein
MIIYLASIGAVLRSTTAGAAPHTQESMFFSEEKNQKTFMS